jgi:prephenate dehydrogenase
VATSILESNDEPSLIVTDVAGVKGSIVDVVLDPRFLGGHPMAGSELRGLSGARSDLFADSTWVLTPTDRTSAEVYSALHGVLREIGANVVAIGADDHDRLVAVASHVPHLLAGSLMNEASQVAEQDAVLLQLAAGGFRDMTRVAAGDPSIWPDILFENREAVAQSLASLEGRLRGLREALLEGGRDVILDSLLSAASARRQLPGRALSSDDLAYLRVKVSDEPGVLAKVTMAASELLVNIYDIEIAHGIEGVGGTLLLAIDAQQTKLFGDALTGLGFQVVREG